MSGALVALFPHLGQPARVELSSSRRADQEARPSMHQGGRAIESLSECLPECHSEGFAEGLSEGTLGVPLGAPHTDEFGPLCP